MNVFWKTSGHYVGLVLLLACSSAIAQELELPISPNPVGSGARAAGMASAFVAIADDATAASWNPAGLVQLERPEISVVGSFNAITELFNADPSFEGFKSSHADHNADLNFLSVVYPLPWTIRDRNITVSLSFQQKYDLSRAFDAGFTHRRTLPSGSFIDTTARNQFDQDGSLSVITPALAFELTHRLSVGVAANFWRDSPLGGSGWSSVLRSDVQVTNADGLPIDDFQRSQFQEYRDVRGENFSIGVLWSPSTRLSFGARYDTRLRAKANFFSETRDSRTPDIVETVSEQRQLSIPEIWAIGTAFRFNDRLTLSLDVTTADWNDFYYQTADGIRLSLVDNQNIDDPDDPTKFDRTFTVRLGAEYVLIPDVLGENMNHLWTLRGGLFFDQEPASGRPTTDTQLPGDGEPDDFYGFSIGAGLQIFGRLNFDIAYELRYGNNVNSDFIRGIDGFEEDVVQHRVLLSSVIYF